MGVGMPAEIMLREFGEHIRRAFGEMAYHVGSSLREKSGWRDVDVRVMLEDEDYAALGFGYPEEPQRNAKWVSTVLAWSAFGRALTGLPIDFQVQQRSHANGKTPGNRSSLFLLHTLVDATPEPQPCGAFCHATGDQAHFHFCPNCGRRLRPQTA